MSGISLTAGMRSNLYALQQTANMMDQTQTKLSTGKKVNSALDNPTSYFTAKSHMERAAGLDAYKDGMSEAVQAINAANTGIEGITSLIDSAIAVAKSAKEAEASSSNVTQTITLSDVDAGDKITLGTTVYTASLDGTGGGDFQVGDTDAETAANLAYLINSTTEAGTDLTATSVGGSTINLACADGTDMVASDVTIASADEDAFSEATVSGSDEMANLKDQYAELISQLNSMVDDANYKGTNLLKDGTDYNLTVSFTDDKSLSLTGFDASATGLAIDSDGTGWTSESNIQSSIGKLEDAKDTLEVQASNLSSNLSIITARQDFTDAMINTLETGADNLTLADMNEEGANMLMLQTRQSLGVTSLSMSAQAAQSVLRLF